MRLRVFSLLFVLTSLSVAAIQPDPNEKLGTVHFPISCASSQQKSFERGVALLHTFWYDKAQEQFKEIEHADPKCAIAYWGEAMSIFHQIWDRPNEKTRKSGLAIIQKSKKLQTSQRERGYIDALVTFYRNPGNNDYDARINAYAEAMEKLSKQYPDDHEAAAFYGLALLSAAPPRDPSHANEKKTLALLEPLFVVEPDHPGIPHYIIHACDNPEMAQKGLNAAERYGEISASAPHAVHMPGHIFARLGMWPEDIKSNQLSVVAAEKSGSMGHALHAMDFLNYAYLQVGEDAKAHELGAKLASMNDMKGHDMHGYLQYARAEFPATYAIEMRHWKEAATLSVDKDAEPQNQALTYGARAVGHGFLHDAAGARQDLAEYDKLVEQVKKSEYAYEAELMGMGRDQIRAWIAFADGKNDEAAQLMRSVADKQDAQGKGEVEIPAREMLADMLLESNHPEQALGEYEQSMKIDPNRFNGLYGAARAAELAKQSDKAEHYYAQLVKNCASSKSSRPELARAKQAVSGKNAAAGK